MAVLALSLLLFVTFVLSSRFLLKIGVAYQPEWHGRIKRLNLTLRYAITKSCDGDFFNWPSVVPTVLLGLRSRPSSRSGFSPFYLMFGVSPRLPLDRSVPLTRSLPARLVDLSSLPALRFLMLRPSSSSSQVKRFPLNSFVLALTPALRMRNVHNKLRPRYLGLSVLLNCFHITPIVLCLKIIAPFSCTLLVWFLSFLGFPNHLLQAGSVVRCLVIRNSISAINSNPGL
jgi:hypothetical protein